jgi:hypothetical protein
MSDGHPSPGDAHGTNEPDRDFSFQPVRSSPQGGATATIGSWLDAVVATLGRNTLIALAGALITLVAFFTLPYITASVEAVNTIVTPVLDALCGTSGCNFAFSAAQIAGQDGVVLLVPLLVLLAAGCLALAALRPQQFTALTPRNAAWAALAGAALALLVLVVQLSTAQTIVAGAGPLADLLRGVAGIRLSAGMGVGFWLMALGVLVVLAAAALELRRLSPPSPQQSAS